MLNKEQIAHFDTFGFVFIRNLLDESEINELSLYAQEIFDEHINDTGEKYPGLSPFFELNSKMDKFVVDKRVSDSVKSLLGDGFLWVGSEGNITNKSEHGWHPDRTGTENQLQHRRLKVMFYLDETTQEKGCLRVIPGSQNYQMHTDIRNGTDAPPDSGEDADYIYGIKGRDFPAYFVESNPGDVLFFNQSLWHSVYNGFPGRRYLAMKFAAKPENNEHIESLNKYSLSMFSPHENYLNSKDSRIRSMIDPILKL